MCNVKWGILSLILVWKKCESGQIAGHVDQWLTLIWEEFTLATGING